MATGRNYDRESDHCIYGIEWDNIGYLDTMRGQWFKCFSPYCNKHGLEERQKRARKWERQLADGQVYHYLTVHFGKVTDYAKRTKTITRWKQLLNRLGQPLDICTVPHWRDDQLHFHICVSAQATISQKTLKTLLVKAATEVKCDKPSRIRLGYKIKDQSQPFLVYAFRIGKYADDLVLPPRG